MANRGMAKVQLIGNLGKDPEEMRYTQAGKEFTRFSLACGRTSRDASGNQVEETDWFNVSIFGGQAKVALDYLKKGSRVFIEGRLQIRQYDDKDGVRRTSVDVVASDLMLIDSRRDQDSGGGGGYGGGNSGGSNDDDYAPAPQPQAQQRPNRPQQGGGSAPQQGRRNQPPSFDEDADDIPF